MPNKSTLTALSLALIASSAAHAQATSIREDRTVRAFKLDIRPEYTTGKYGGPSSIDESSLNFSAQYDTERFAFKLSVPYLHIRSDQNALVVEPGVIVCEDDRRGRSNNSGPGGGGSGSNSGPGSGGDDDNEARTCSTLPGATSTTTEKTTQSGWGDLVGAVTYKVLPGAPEGWLLDLTGKVKFPTADRDKGLGTGKADYSLQADVSKSIGDFTPFLGLGYKWRGKPADLALRDSAYGSVGAAYRVARGTEIELAYDYRQRASANSAAARELAFTVYHRVSDLLRLSGFVSKGYSDASPDWGAGLGVSVRF